MSDYLPRKIDDWVVIERRPASPGPSPVFLLLHGWTGDENSMGVFSSRLPKSGLLIAPRGLYPTGAGGYGWSNFRTGQLACTADFAPAIEALIALLTEENFPTADLSLLNLVGFSQGAVLAYTFLLTLPERVRSVAGLSGFLPGDAEKLATSAGLAHKPVFIAHGQRDTTVPVELGRQAARLLGQAGADVTYCEDNVGHKLSASCFRGLEKYSSELVFGGA